MSLQPSPHSNHKNLDNNQWHELLKFAEVLSTQLSLESQLSFAIWILESLFSCHSRVWLALPFSDLLRSEGLQNNATLVSDLSPLMEQAYRERQIIPNLRSGSKEVDVTSVIAIPLLINDEVLGTIQLDRENQAGFTFEDVDLINGFAIQISIALNHLRQKTLDDKLEQYIDQLTWITKISQSILSNLDRDNLLNSVISLLHQKFGFSRVNILIAREDDKKVLTQIGISEDGIEPKKTYYYEKENGPVAWCISHLEPIAINDLDLNNGFSVSNLEKNIRSELVLPLIHGDLFIGVLDLCSNTSNSFEPDTIKIFQLLSENIAGAIRNANLYRSEHMRRLISDRLHDVVGSLSADESFDNILHIILDEMEQFLPWDAAAIWLTDTSGDESGLGQFTSSLRLISTRIKEKPTENDQIHSADYTEIFNQYIQNTDDVNDLLTIYPWISEVVNTKIPGLRRSSSTYEPLGAILGFASEYSTLGAPLNY